MPAAELEGSIAMRQIVLDTETTGLDPAQGHRVIEIGAVELVNRRPSGRTYHQYLQPDRAIDEGAQDVHGISAEFLADKPRFADVVDEFLAFVSGAQLVIHNAPFDVGFLDAELARLDRGRIEDHCTVLDTLALARDMHPGQRNSLDALCRRYEIDNSHRELHGALLDAEILADVYLAMTGGQVSLSLDGRESGQAATEATRRPVERPPGGLRVIHPTAEELAAHRDRLAAIDAASADGCRWRD